MGLLIRILMSGNLGPCWVNLGPVFPLELFLHDLSFLSPFPASEEKKGKGNSRGGVFPLIACWMSSPTPTEAIMGRPVNGALSRIVSLPRPKEKGRYDSTTQLLLTALRRVIDHKGE